MSYKKRNKTIKMIGIIGLIAIANVACKSSKRTIQSGPDNHGWSIVKTDSADNPAWTIYMRNEQGSSFYEYKIEGNIDASPEVCITSFKSDLYNLANGITKEEDYKYTTYTILNESSDTMVVYAIHKEPFPLKNTEMNIRYVFYEDTSGNAGVTWKEAWSDFPIASNKKLNRVDMFRGSWQFEVSTDNSFKAVNVVQFNLEGQPIWFAQPMVIKFLRKGFNDFKETVPSQNTSNK